MSLRDQIRALLDMGPPDSVLDIAQDVSYGLANDSEEWMAVAEGGAVKLIGVTATITITAKE